ncbi:MAG: pitrilysin family protein [Saprospiraceae bacterium]
MRPPAPPIHKVEELKLRHPQLYHLSNGIPVYDINMGSLPVVKIEIVFFAGRPFEKKQLAARTTASLLREGSANYSSAEIANAFDFYGGSLSIPVSMDTSNVLIYSLTRHLDKLLPIVADVLTRPSFPQKELDLYVARAKKRLQLDLSKNDVIAYRTITEKIFGEDHPYGYNSLPETYEALSREDLISHFEENYTAGNCMVFVSGDTGELLRNKLEQYLGRIPRGPQSEAFLPSVNAVPEKFKIERPGTVQSAIRIGRQLFNRKHPDYNGMYVLNTILGGYFGSRLMENIREDKGYTYNIYSTHDAFFYDGYFYVGTDVGKEFLEPTIKEIHFEMERLQSELVGAGELEMVRNYLLGNLLTNLDGPFNVAEVVKTFIQEGMSLDDFDKLIQTISSIGAEEIRTLAEKYLSPKDMIEVVVG